MACVWLESFDIDANAGNWALKYDNVNATPGTTTPRLATGGLAMNSATNTSRFRTKAFKNGLQRTYIMGFAIKPPNGQGAEYKILTLLNGTANEQVSLWGVQGSTTSRFKLRVKRGSTTLGTTTTEWNTTFWIFVEWKVVIDTNGTDGSVEVRVNESVELTVSNTDTSNHDAQRTADRVEYTFNNAVAGTQVDDMYVCDDTGSLNNNFLGDVSVEGKLPSADGNRNQWTPSTGTNHAAMVDEASLDSDSTYLSIANTSNGQVELFTIPDVVQIITSVFAVQVTSAHRMDSSGTDKFRYIFRNGSAVEATSAIDNTVSSIAGYQWYQEIYDQDPTTAAAWTISGFNGMQIGVESRP